jgi:hypothetical protein
MSCCVDPSIQINGKQDTKKTKQKSQRFGGNTEDAFGDQNGK